MSLPCRPPGRRRCPSRWAGACDNSAVDLDGISTLLTRDGWALLESLPEYDESSAMALIEQLQRDGHPAEMISAALTQSRLRSAAQAKFGPFAAGMLFTPTGLEQATRLPVAARHAQRFASAGITRVADLGCGIGADSMAMAGLDREVLAVEKDEVTAAIATVNLRHWPEAVVRHEDAMTTDLSGVQGAFLDPARRATSGRRLLDPRAGSPPLSFVHELVGRDAVRPDLRRPLLLPAGVGVRGRAAGAEGDELLQPIPRLLRCQSERVYRVPEDHADVLRLWSVTTRDHDCDTATVYHLRHARCT